LFSRVLVAARGEIALRIIRACKELGVETVAVFSQADSDGIYLRLAEQKICIGPSASSESYLNIPSIIAAAEIANVDAIHPGYGFLSEMSHFAEVCDSCNICFIGPSQHAMEVMGDKARARALATGADIPVVPGSDGPIESEKAAVELARKIGYPVLIKAVSGGGGKGIRLAYNDVSLANSIGVASSEAEANFGLGEVYLEKYITNARHVEFQILGDHHGNIIHLGERDCSLQRRHQKLVEESPCPVINEELRQKMGEAALSVARAAEYYGAGTVEFLLDKDLNYYFIEMNCRIQVEHPVTEMVTGIDILKEQIKMAAGERLSYRQSDIHLNGTAIECRINAEDPEHDFKPHPGKVSTYFPPGGFGVRLDSHLYSGYQVPSAYDSLIAKLIVHRKTRPEAMDCMRRALQEYVIGGVKTTIPLYLEIFGHRAFLDAEVDTTFVENTFGQT